MYLSYIDDVKVDDHTVGDKGVQGYDGMTIVGHVCLIYFSCPVSLESVTRSLTFLFFQATLSFGSMSSV